jgi:hypothetical protein
LRERIAEEMDGSRLSCESFALFRRYAVKHCPDLRLCELIAITAKHLECRNLDSGSEFNTTAVPAEVTFVNKQGQALTFANNLGQPITWTNGAWELWVTNEAGLKHRAADVFATAHDWWTQFIYGNQVDEEQEPLPEEFR